MRKKYIVVMVSAILVFGLSGCKFVRELDISQIEYGDNVDSDIPDITENPVPIVVQGGRKIDTEAVFEYFYGEKIEDLKKEGYVERYSSEVILAEKNGINVTWIAEQDYNTNPGEKLYMEYFEENASYSYIKVLGQSYFQGLISNRFMGLFPEEDLQHCSRAEAIEACQPLAEACGYGDAQVNVYAMKKEILNNLVEEACILEAWKFNAPDPDYDYAKEKELKDRAEAAEEEGDDKLAEQLSAQADQIFEESDKREIPWSERTEAYVVVYTTLLNGRRFENFQYQLICVYVPSMERIVYAEGNSPLTVTETLAETELMTREEAVAEAWRELEMSTEDVMTITGMSLVYVTRYVDIYRDVERKVIEPCWRIDYEMEPELIQLGKRYNYDDGTIFINAVDGGEVEL